MLAVTMCAPRADAAAPYFFLVEAALRGPCFRVPENVNGSSDRGFHRLVAEVNLAAGAGRELRCLPEVSDVGTELVFPSFPGELESVPVLFAPEVERVGGVEVVHSKPSAS